MRWDEPGDPRSYQTVEAISCCDCGLADRARRGSQFCPFIIRRYPAGYELFSYGDHAEYVWLVMDGVVGLRRGDADDERVDELRLPGSTVGLHCVDGGRHDASAHTLSEVSACGATRQAYERWKERRGAQRLGLPGRR